MGRRSRSPGREDMGHGRAPGEAWVQVARKGAVWTCMVASEDSSARLGRSRRSSGLSTVLSLFAAGPSWSTTRSTWRLPAPQRISTWSSAHPPSAPVDTALGISRPPWLEQGLDWGPFGTLHCGSLRAGNSYPSSPGHGFRELLGRGASAAILFF